MEILRILIVSRKKGSPQQCDLINSYWTNRANLHALAEELSDSFVIMQEYLPKYVRPPIR